MPIFFKGYWGDGDEKSLSEPWETFEIGLWGREAGDYVTGKDVHRVLKASGYRVILEKIDSDA